MQAELQMNCISLVKNIVNSPSSSCGGFESADHFFFVCPKYRHIRKVRNMAKIRKRYNQVPHMTQDTTWDRSPYLSDVLQSHTTHDLLHGNGDCKRY